MLRCRRRACGRAAPFPSPRGSLTSPSRTETEERPVSHDHDHGHDHDHDHPAPDHWRDHGVKVIPGDNLDPNTAQTPGMNRATAINKARAGGGEDLGGHGAHPPDAKTGAHHHGDLESIIYVRQRGRARMRWARSWNTAEAGPGDFIYVPPYVPHQEINARRTRSSNACSCAPGRNRWW